MDLFHAIANNIHDSAVKFQVFLQLIVHIQLPG